MFFKKSSKGPRKERYKEKAVDTDTTESGDSEDEGPTCTKKSKFSTLLSLKRNRRVKGKEMLRKSMEATRRKDVTPETYSGDVNLSEYLSQFEACTEWNGWSERQKDATVIPITQGKGWRSHQIKE